MNKIVSSRSENGRSALAGLVPRYLGKANLCKARCMEAFQVAVLARGGVKLDQTSSNHFLNPSKYAL